ncbi:FtsK/SpoIIIE domain-containing protein [Amycolatopsis sp. WQ 127309]|uniref:FtsK/SpoIIIE domain-containing protein n=1 Tax=Amycolatopsis sp. WQ 127309 TaxID=2932773 RepID=UPI001FF60107|nr:FtsK/SpoIIIE domain-containing protein [Amycolatopsis sp. WQ 127309]UOZ04626.1 cell division protein FtsK [Amycolatopsis sp. WQ 127309]
MNTPKSSRKVGTEIKALKWLLRHPGATVGPGALVGTGLELGWSATGGITGGTASALLCWYRAHPDTFDHYAAPRLRAWRRRWSAYFGPRFTRALRACDMYVTDRKTGEDLFPRITRLRSFSPSVDVVTLALARGQARRSIEESLERLADTLKVQRIAFEHPKPGYVALIIERSEPFTETIPAPEMPDTVDAVDVNDIYVGDTEYGTDWRLKVAGTHVFVAGATGAGKNSIVMSMLRGLAPLIRDGLVRLWVCDPKQLEFRKFADGGVAHRYADNEQDCAELVDDYVNDLRCVQQQFAATGTRKITISRETPLNLLIIDEIGALLAYGDGSIARNLRKQLAIVGSQGRATGHGMTALVQEPTKDTVPVRELFPTRICLRVTAQSHVDMVLGDGARLRGALADEIPNVPDTAGIGYVVRQRTRVPQRVRAAYVDDREIDELITFIRSGRPVTGLSVVA